MANELTTVATHHAVIHRDGERHALEGLEPDTAYERDGHAFRTLPEPGELLCTFATVNDVHFGETLCGVNGDITGEIFRSEPGEDPYPEMMNRGAIAEIEKLAPAAVVAKGDLTDRGTIYEYRAFLEFYHGAFGDRLHHVRGNHDAYQGEHFASDAPFFVDLPGVRLAVIDTVRPRHTPGQVTLHQTEWLSDLAAESDRPVLVFGHHHVWDPAYKTRPDDYFGIHPDDSERLIDVVAQQSRILGYFAGHTHRNRVRRLAATGDVPWVEVACVKDYPGTWAEYRVHEGGVLQIHHRISTPEALEWSEKTRDLYTVDYASYALGVLEQRCFPIWPRG